VDAIVTPAVNPHRTVVNTPIFLKLLMNRTPLSQQNQETEGPLLLFSNLVIKRFIKTFTSSQH
jgi:hypothetical protein